VFQASFEGIP